MPLMMQTDRCHRMIIEGQVHRLGVHRTQHMILMCLSHCEKPPTQSEIAELFQVSNAAVAVSLRKMEQAGLILRTSREGNARHAFLPRPPEIRERRRWKEFRKRTLMS